MKRLSLILLLVVGCAYRAPHTSLTPADSTSHSGEHHARDAALALGLAAFFALWVVPGAGKIIRGDP